MKKILLFVLIFICLKSFGQYPTKQTLGTDSTIITSKGSLQSRIINKSFSDTTQANTQRIKFYDGAQIWTTSDNNFWLRDSANNKWVLPGGGIGTIDSLIVATQTDIAQTSTYSPVAFDTLERKVLLNGAVTGRDEAFPSVERLPNGSLVVGWASTIAHATLGMGKYMTSGNDGLNWTAPVTLEADPNWNYRNLIFSRTRGDTTAVHYWSAFSNRIYLRHSINSLSSISAKDSITSSVVLASEDKIQQFLGYNVMAVYSFAPDVPRAGIAYKTSLTGGTWNFTWFDIAHDGLQLSEGTLIVEGDTLFYFLRSDANLTTMYRAYTVNLTSLSTPATATPAEWTAGAPRVIRLQDGRYFINYRTTDGSAPDEGAYAVSNDRGRTWTKVGEQHNRLWAYGSTIPIGDAIYLNVYSGQLSLDGTLYQDVFSFPGTDFINSGKTIQRNDLRWDWIKHLMNRGDSTSAGRDLGIPGRLNVVATNTGVSDGLNIIEAGTAAATAITHRTNGLEINANNAAAPTTWERRAKFYDVTATGTDPVIDIGDNTSPFFRFHHNGTIKTTKPFLYTGAGAIVFENDATAEPSGASGVGLRVFRAGGASYLLSQTAGAGYAPLNMYATTLTMNADLSVVGNVTVAGLTASLPVKTNGSKTLVSAAIALGGSEVSGDLLYSNLTQGAALSVLGVTGNATADVASIAAGTDHQVLRRSGTSLAFGALNLASANAVTGILPIANIATGTPDGTKFVRDDGTLAVPPGGSADLSFETITYSATPSVAFDPDRPNKQFTLTGNIAITNTGTSNGSSGMYLIIQDGTGNRTVSINGTSIPVNPVITSATLIGWTYNGTIYAFDKNTPVVTDFVFTDANGFDGTVSTSTTTPTLSLTTTVTSNRLMYSSSGAITGASALQTTGQDLSIVSSNTTSDIFAVGANSLTTARAIHAASSSLTSGKLLNLDVNGTGALTGQAGIGIVLQGTNATSTQTTYGATFQNGHAGTASTNVAGWFSAQNGTNNYALIAQNGQVGIGTATPVASALTEMTSTTQGFLPPRMTTTQRDAITSPATGLEIYNTTTSVPNFYNGSAWTAVGTGGGGWGTTGTVATLTGASTLAMGTNTFNFSNGNVGIGPTTPTVKFQLSDDVETNAFFDISTNANEAPEFSWRRARGTTASKTIVTNDNRVGRLLFQGHDGVQYKNTAEIRAEIDGTPGENDVPGRLVFYTTPDGTGSTVERLRVSNNGAIAINSTITAGGTTGAQTINKPSGTVNIAAAGTTVTVTNSLVTTSSLVFAVIRTADATARITNVVPGSGSFVINIVAATGEVSIGFFVLNGN